MPERPAAWVNLGVCRAAMGQFDEAVAAYEEALRQDPSAKAAVLNLAGLLATQQPAAAVDVLTRYLRRRPADVDVLRVATRILLSASGVSRALILWQSALQAQPDNAELRGWYAWTLCMVGEWDDGQRAAQAAEDFDSQVPVVWMVISATHVLRGEHAAAELAMAPLVEKQALQEPEMFDAFAALLQNVAAQRPDDPWPYYLLCKACVATDRSDVAELAAQEFKQRTSDAKLHARIDSVLAGDFPESE